MSQFNIKAKIDSIKGEITIFRSDQVFFNERNFMNRCKVKYEIYCQEQHYWLKICKE